MMRKTAEFDGRLRRRLAVLLMVLTALLAFAAAWKWSPLHVWLDVAVVVSSLQYIGQSFGMVAAVGVFALAVSVAIPVTFLALVTLAAFGPWVGFVCAMAGALVGAGLSYGLGRVLGREAVQAIGGARVNLLSQRLASRGLLAVVVLRLVPIAPFAVVNMVAGASHIRLRDMLLGTLIGMLPSMLALMIFMDQIVAALRQPSPTSLLLLVVTVVLILLGWLVVRHWIRHTDMSE
jgi:uncharacterized membrane protein YdjX (TVP38/TMEM64 family)